MPRQIRTDLAALLDVEHPSSQTPMGGGIGTPELAAAAPNAGAHGGVA